MIKKFFSKNKKKIHPISTKSVKFGYKDQEVLRDISVDIKKGNITAIIGKSGSGKSTLLKIISGIISGNYSGKIRIFGWPNFLKKNKIGFVSQNVSVIPDLSIEDNIKIFGLNLGLNEERAQKRAFELMDMLKFEVDIKKKPTELSGGQKVRLNILLSLLHDPETIILDEPFVGLDFLNRKLLWHFLHSMKKKGKSVVLTSHLLTETQDNVDKIVIIKNGKIFYKGNVDALKNRLKIAYVFEVQLSRLSKENKEKIAKYCVYYNIKIIDSYNNYFMFALEKENIKDRLERLFSRLQLNYEIIGFREPNLDEVFLKT